MVLMSAGKNARYQSSIIARPTCGGVKKTGTAPSSGYFFNTHMKGHLYGAPQSMPKFCMRNKVIQTQKYGYSAVHSGNMG
jgi:hypothetical protein